MKIFGVIRKMKAVMGNPLRYYLFLDKDVLLLNTVFGREIIITHEGYSCCNCGKDVPLFRMGFCKKCFFESPYASETIIRPELSRAHLGEEERDLEVEKQIQLQPHVVYLSYTGDIKVGVTRKSNIPSRWVDQGATYATIIAETPNRYEAGLIEVTLKNHISDTTAWRKMLEDSGDSIPDFETALQRIEEYWPEESKAFKKDNLEVIRLQYPYSPPEKIIGLKLEKSPKISGVLSGIKGQYLNLDTGLLNLYAHEGYKISLEIN